MADIIFSGSHDTLGKPDDRWVIRAIGESNVRVSVLFQAPEMSTWRMDKRLFPMAITARNKFIKFVPKILNERLGLSESSDRKDIFSFLAKAKDPETGNGFGLAELGAESTTLIVAGESARRSLIVGS
jgi:cytochrome P450